MDTWRGSTSVSLTSLLHALLTYRVHVSAKSRPKGALQISDQFACFSGCEKNALRRCASDIDDDLSIMTTDRKFTYRRLWAFSLLRHASPPRPTSRRSGPEYGLAETLRWLDCLSAKRLWHLRIWPPSIERHEQRHWPIDSHEAHPQPDHLLRYGQMGARRNK
jgi:hypothetical protein